MIGIHEGILSLSPSGSRTLSASFTLQDSDVAVLVGKNGAGKTSLLDALIGMRTLVRGTLHPNPRTSAIAYAVQDPNGGLLPWHTIRQNIMLPRLLEDEDHAAANDPNEALARFGLRARADDYPYQLSQGEKQVVNLIRAICSPGIAILLDEPFAPLGSSLLREARRQVESSARSRPMVVVTHDLDDLRLPFNRFFLIDCDALVEVDSATAKERLRDDASQDNEHH